jgi:hypothetical protein
VFEASRQETGLDIVIATDRGNLGDHIDILCRADVVGAHSSHQKPSGATTDEHQ